MAADGVAADDEEFRAAVVDEGQGSAEKPGASPKHSTVQKSAMARSGNERLPS
jgi:hypothetical protein